MKTVQHHRDLEAWRRAIDLTTETYRLTDNFPAKERFGLQGQMRRAAVSVPSNIAEGQFRPLGAAINHLSIASGSLAELDTQLEIALRLQYLNEEAIGEFRRLHESTRRLVFGLRRAKRLLVTRDAARSVGIVLMVLYLLSRVVA